MSPSSFSFYLILIIYCVISVRGAPVDTIPVEDGLITALQTVGNKTCPELEKLDFGFMFGPDLTPEQITAVHAFAGDPNIVTQSVANIESDDLLTIQSTSISAEILDRMQYIAIYASISYIEAVESITNWTCGPRCVDARVSETVAAQVFDIDSSLGFIAVRPLSKEIVVSFRGTSNIQNWLDNIDLIREDWPFPISTATDNASVHRGFVDSYQAIRGQIRPAIQNLAKENPDYAVIVTGHSLGAAVATIAALDLIGENELSASRIDLMVFASPRLGNSEFSKLVSNVGFRSVHRYVHENDIVPHVPPRFLGYEHIVGELFSESGSVRLCEGSEDSSCSNSKVPFLSVGAHDNFLNTDVFFSSNNPA